jgi:hypothetical protein
MGDGGKAQIPREVSREICGGKKEGMRGGKIETEEADDQKAAEGIFHYLLLLRISGNKELPVNLLLKKMLHQGVQSDAQN